MDITEFWALIDQAREAAGGDVLEQQAALRAALTGRSSEDLQAFRRHYDAGLGELYRWDVWGVGFALAGGMSDDAFDYFCDWIISRGPVVFAAALKDPESLADVEGAVEEPEAEGLRYVVLEAHERTHGGQLPETGSDTRDFDAGPAGEEWDEEDVDERFPRAAAKSQW
ncbi:DUF4240 domain-containing protein [Baekduia sp. Peel2402]|uniref:DUF4240 domain-containing protein n=1 Tax=Baekduia sp. Peel2402 TaxID=3458296 RepID=UPI00403ED713